MAKMPLTCPTMVRLLLDYDAATGVLIWRDRQPWMFKAGRRLNQETQASAFAKNFAGKVAFTCKNAKGYATGAIQRQGFLAHRVAWCHATGKWPTGQIDHINHVTDDNRLSNLREATASQNMSNRRAFSGCKYSQYKGVCKAKATGHWTAAISINGRQTHLGSFRTEIAAAKAYAAAATKQHGEYACVKF